MKTIQSKFILFEIGKSKRIKSGFVPLRKVFNPCDMIIQKVPLIHDVSTTEKEALKKSNCNQVVKLEFI